MKDKRFCKKFIDEVLDGIFAEIGDFDVSVKRMVCEEFEGKIFENCFKEFVYCLNTERVNGNLKGDTLEERYIFFNETGYGVQSIKETFKNLYDELKYEFKDKIKFVLNVIDEYNCQKNEISKIFFKGEKFELLNIKCGGDWHDNKCVVIVNLERDEKIVYKPTNGYNIHFFQKVISCFFKEDEYVQLYDSLLCENGYWCRFVEHKELHNSVYKFYYNYGKILFIAYLLGMNDLHYENMIAHYMFPVITDLETIFSTYIFVDTRKYLYEAQRMAVSILSSGTIATGLLPVLSLIEYFGGDISCLSNNGTKIKVQKTNNMNRDDMSIYDEYEIVRKSEHLPNNDVKPLEYAIDILQGFDDAFFIFGKSKNELKNILDNEGDKVETRVILAMSKAYAKIIRMKSEVLYRYDHEKYIKLIDKLKNTGEYDAERFNYERNELIGGNIPCYYWNTLSKKIFTFYNNEKKYISSESNLGIDDLWNRIQEQLGERNIIRQRQYIMDSIKTCSALTMVPDEKEIIAANKDIEAVDKDVVKQEYRIIIEGIKNQVVRGNDRTVEWIALTVAEQDQLAYQTMNESIYNGSSGLGILFLQYLKQNDDEEMKQIIYDMIHTYSVKVELGLFDSMDASYFNGLAGIYSFLKKCSVELCDERKIEIQHLQKKIETLILKNIETTSLYDNVSGLLSSAIYFYGLYKYEKNVFAEKILKKIERRILMEYDVQYVIENLNFASFAHGYEAQLTGLLCIYHFSQNKKLLMPIDQLFHQQKKLELDNYYWKDTRRKDITQSVHFWCHGSCGIMISRLIWKKLHLLDSNELMSILDGYDVDASLNEYAGRIVSGEFDGVNYSLCHGNIALVDFLISYSKVFNKGGEKAIRQYIFKVINKAIKNKFNCITPGAINSISFMVGEAGIAYTFQRALDNAAVSIISLEII